MSEPKIHTPIIVTDGGPWASHDHACSVCHEQKSILDLHSGVFLPCDMCRRVGWTTRRRVTIAQIKAKYRLSSLRRNPR